MAIGERIKNARIKKGLTQEELAGLLGYKSKSSVAHIENGRDIPRAMVVKLAQVLDTTPAYLMGWDDTSELTATDRATQADAPDPDNWQALRSVLEQLPDEKLDEVLAYAEYLAEKGKKNASE